MPCAVKHADSVCVAERVTADKEKIRTSRIRTVFSGEDKARYKIRTASGEKKKRASADGTDTASVTKREYNTFFRALSPRFFASETEGTLTAAIP